MHDSPAKPFSSKPSIICGLVLAGGQGRRMLGKDKGLIEWQGRALVDHVCERLAPQVNRILISANRNQPEYEKMGYEVITDLDRNSGNVYNGPMAGIYSAIKTLESSGSSQCLVVTPCDTPHLPANYVAKLYDAQRIDHSDVTVVFDGSRRQNLHCLIHSNTWASLIDFYETGGTQESGLALREWFAQVTTQDVDFSAQAEAFRNMNSPEDLL